MHHSTPLITTIVGGLVLAFLFGTLAHRLRISPLVGYLAAGVLAGPFTPGFVADTSLAPELAEIGVILLMFGVGLHFSLKRSSRCKINRHTRSNRTDCRCNAVGDGIITFLRLGSDHRAGLWSVPINRQYRGIAAGLGRTAID